MVKEFPIQKEYTMFDAVKRAMKQPVKWIELSEKDKALEILQEVSRVFEIPVEKIISKTRKKDVVIPRHIYCYIAGKITGASLKEIGENVGGRDHTTVIHSKQTMKDMFETNDDKFMHYWYRYVYMAKTHLVP